MMGANEVDKGSALFYHPCAVAVRAFVVRLADTVIKTVIRICTAPFSITFTISYEDFFPFTGGADFF